MCAVAKYHFVGKNNASLYDIKHPVYLKTNTRDWYVCINIVFFFICRRTIEKCSILA